jgi:hypothetical protein
MWFSNEDIISFSKLGETIRILSLKAFDKCNKIKKNKL